MARRPSNAERSLMLHSRRVRQELREPGFTPATTRNFYPVGKVEVMPAWMNRRTGEPHEHAREKARRLARNA